MTKDISQQHSHVPLLQWFILLGAHLLKNPITQTQSIDHCIPTWCIQASLTLSDHSNVVAWSIQIDEPTFMCNISDHELLTQRACGEKWPFRFVASCIWQVQNSCYLPFWQEWKKIVSGLGLEKSPKGKSCTIHWSRLHQILWLFTVVCPLWLVQHSCIAPEPTKTSEIYMLNLSILSNLFCCAAATFCFQIHAAVVKLCRLHFIDFISDRFGCRVERHLTRLHVMIAAWSPAITLNHFE